MATSGNPHSVADLCLPLALATNPAPTARAQSTEWSNNDVPEFIPQGYQQSHQQHLSDGTGSTQDPFASYDGAAAYSESDAAAASLNPYAQDATSSAAAAAAFFQSPNAFNQPLQYHLYAPVGPHRENLLSYQRAAHDFFIKEDLRQDMQRRAEATLQTLPSTSIICTD